MTDIQIVVPAANWCGEGPLWSASKQVLYWTDINRFLLQRYDPATGNVRYWMFDEPVCATALTDRPGTLLLALGSKVILWDEATDERTDFAAPETNLPASRLNDGRPSPFGDFWVGSMRNNVDANGQGTPVDDHQLGSLYRVRRDGTVTLEDEKLGISNTVCWSPDGTVFYFGDTLQNTIFAWDYDAASGDIANKRPFFSGFDRGGPDGSAIDQDGYLWNARYGGSCVVRVAPDGSVDRIVEMPVSNLTSCTFGGADLKTLFITSAAQPGELHAGSVFSMPVDVPGQPENTFRLTD
jgi:sugar lactone lactonase YvrE